MLKPTPTPWYRNIRPVTKYPIVYAGSSPNHDYCFSFHVPRGVTPEQAEANLDFLLRAVNNHQRMVEALEAIQREAIETRDGPSHQVRGGCSHIAVLAGNAAALAKGED